MIIADHRPAFVSPFACTVPLVSRHVTTTPGEVVIGVSSKQYTVRADRLHPFKPTKGSRVVIICGEKVGLVGKVSAQPRPGISVVVAAGEEPVELFTSCITHALNI